MKEKLKYGKQLLIPGYLPLCDAPDFSTHFATKKLVSWNNSYSKYAFTAIVTKGTKNLRE